MQNGHRNRLLNTLAPDELARLRADGEYTELPLRRVLFEPDVPIDAVYFIEDGVASIVADRDAGRVEVATVGREGMVGLPVFLGGDSVHLTAFMQIPGHGVRVPA